MASVVSGELDGMSNPALTRDWKLPTIPDRWWPTVRRFWLVALIAVIAVNVIGGAGFVERKQLRPFSHLGLGWKPVGGKIVLMDGLTREATNSGIRKGQRIVAVDGRPISDALADIDEVQRALIRPDDTPVVVTTIDDRNMRADHRLTRRKANIDESLAVSGLTGDALNVFDIGNAFIPTVIMIVAAALLLRSRKRETVVALLAYGFMAFAATSPAATVALSGRWANWFLLYVLNPTGIFALFTALLAFPDGRIRGQLAKFSLLLAACVAIGIASPFASIVIPAFPVLALCTAFALRQRRRLLASDQSILQVRAAMFGLVVGAICFCVGGTSAILGSQSPDVSAAAIWTGVISETAVSCGAVAMAMGLLVSILRYRLYDVDTIISRSAAYGAMTVGFIAIFAGVEKLAEIASEEYFGEDMKMISGAGAAAIAAAIIAPMHNRIHHWAEKKFHSTLQALRTQLPALVEDMRETASLSDFGQAVVDRLGEGVRATGCELRVDGATVASTGSDCASYEYAVPLVAAGSELNIGELVLGPRPDGSGYNKDEREALDAVAQPIGRAVDVVRRREAKEKALDRRIAAIEAAILGNGREGKIA